MSTLERAIPVAEAPRRGTGTGLSGRLSTETDLPLATVRLLRPHAARHGTTVPLVALEIVEAAVDLGCVDDLVADRAMPEPCDQVAARFALGKAVGDQLRPIGRTRGVRAEIFARAIVEAALDQGRIDRLLGGRFDRGEARRAPLLLSAGGRS